MFVNKWTSGCELTWSFLDTIDLVSPSTKVFPDVLFDSESTKEKQSKIASLDIRQEIDENFPSTRGSPDVLFDSESTKEKEAKISTDAENAAEQDKIGH
jgi:hypothetical protein